MARQRAARSAADTRKRVIAGLVLLVRIRGKDPDQVNGRQIERGTSTKKTCNAFIS
jgi:hypothetical protein